MDVLKAVRRYYDSNTRLFDKHESGASDAVHRAVWGPGVSRREAAFDYVNGLIMERVKGAGRVLDLGCGIGGTLFYLLRRTDGTGLGVTLSPVQAERARRRARELGMQDRVRFRVTSYLDLPKGTRADAAWAVESFVHGPDPGAFFRSAAAALEPGGVLVVCDDFLTLRGAERAQARCLRDFRWGWHVHSLVTPARAAELAREAGFTLEEDHDLTPHLELRRPWDRFIALCVRLFGWIRLDSPWWRSWVGGEGIQAALASGLATYRFLVFRRAAD